MTNGVTTLTTGIELHDIDDIDTPVRNHLAPLLVDTLHRLREAQQETAAYRELLQIALGHAHQIGIELRQESARNERLIVRRHDQRLLRIRRWRTGRAG